MMSRVASRGRELRHANLEVRLALWLEQVMEYAKLTLVVGAPRDLGRASVGEPAVRRRAIPNAVELRPNAVAFADEGAVLLFSCRERGPYGRLDDVRLTPIAHRRARSGRNVAVAHAAELPAHDADDPLEDAVLGEDDRVNVDFADQRAARPPSARRAPCFLQNRTVLRHRGPSRPGCCRTPTPGWAPSTAALRTRTPPTMVRSTTTRPRKCSSSRLGSSECGSQSCSSDQPGNKRQSRMTMHSTQPEIHTLRP